MGPFRFNEHYYRQYMGSAQACRARVHHFRQIIASLPVKLKAPILDIGAGLGFFIRALPPDLARATALVEPSSFARGHLKTSGAMGILCSLEEIPSHFPPFGTATFWDVLAHVENPVEMLVRTRSLMVDGGLLIVKTPHHPLCLFRAARLLARVRKGHSLLHIPSMRYHFTPESLQALLVATGFRVTRWQWTSEPPLSGRRGLALIKDAFLRVGKRTLTGQISFITIATAS